jgi:hypothetical protein
MASRHRPWVRVVVCVQGYAAGRLWAGVGTRSVASTALYGRRLRAAGDSRDREGEALGRLRQRTLVRARVQAKVRAVSTTDRGIGGGVVEGHNEVRRWRDAEARRSLGR